MADTVTSQTIADVSGSKTVMKFTNFSDGTGESLVTKVDASALNHASSSTKIARLIEKEIWLVEIIMPKSLMTDIRTGAIELEDETVDLQDLDDAYSADLDQQQVMNTDAQQEMDTNIDVQV